jgi:hypothetical protein
MTCHNDISIVKGSVPAMRKFSTNKPLQDFPFKIQHNTVFL